MKKTFLTIVLLVTAFARSMAQGTYTNPIIHADYSDPDVCAVGGDFYMTASSFQCTPGLPILHSTDLVHWQTIGYALEELVPTDFYAKPQHGKGVWAPSIRHHNGEFYIYWGDPDFGIYMVKSRHADRGWSKPVLVKAGKGMIDPTPLWDDDGRVYLVHAWAGSRARFNSVLTVCELNAEGTEVVSRPVMVYDGNPNGNHTVEGPKFYKRNGFYYILAPAGGVAQGWQIALRSKHVYGPYEAKTVMAQGKAATNGPHQGAWVHTAMGEDWFVHFQDKGAYGRIIHLQPMEWKDGWPVIGSLTPQPPSPKGEGEIVSYCGEPVMKHKMPKVSPDTTHYEAYRNPMGEGMEWHANYQDVFGFPTSMGYSRVYAHELSEDFVNAWEVPNLLLRKFPAEEFTASAKLKVSAKADGQQSGLIVMGLDYCHIGVEKQSEGFILKQTVCHDAEKGGAEKLLTTLSLPASTEYGAGAYHIHERDIYLRVEVKKDALCTFAYSLDGKRYTAFGQPFKARQGKWIGAKLGIFSTTPHGKERGWVDVYDFNINTENDLDFCMQQVRRGLDSMRVEDGGQIDYHHIPRNIMHGETRWNRREAVAAEWCSGFYPGILWMAYEASGDTTIKAEAEKFSAELEHLARRPAHDHDLGFLAFNSLGHQYRLTGDERVKQLLLDIANTLATLYNPKVGTICSWPNPPAECEGMHNTIIDNTINLELLFWAARNGGSPRLREIAETHARTTLRNQFNDGWRVEHVALYDSITGEFVKRVTHQGHHDGSLWARGQAWAVWGYTMCFRETGDSAFLNVACQSADVFLRDRPDDGIPYWDYDDPAIPNAPRDASAAAVVASGLIELSQYVDTEKGANYLAEAKRILKSLGSEAYRPQDGSVACTLHSTGNLPAGYEVDCSIVYADYYYLEALLRLKALSQK